MVKELQLQSGVMHLSPLCVACTVVQPMLRDRFWLSLFSLVSMVHRVVCVLQSCGKFIMLAWHTCMSD